MMPPQPACCLHENHPKRWATPPPFILSFLISLPYLSAPHRFVEIIECTPGELAATQKSRMQVAAMDAALRDLGLQDGRQI